MKKLIVLPIIILALVLFISSFNSIEREPFAIVQLFTSQGCSSCPSADKLLKVVSRDYYEQNVIVLSYHVDYWDRLGWKDPYSKEEFTNFQRNYGQKFGGRNIYTPQAVINGSIHFVGSNNDKMHGNISRFLRKPAINEILISEVNREKNNISFNYKIDGDIEEVDLKIVLVIDKRTTEVKRGENGGRILENHHIVIDEHKIDLLESNGNYWLTIPNIAKEDDQLKIVAYTQSSDLSIVGATEISLE